MKDRKQLIKIIIIIALFSFSAVYLFFTTIAPNLFGEKHPTATVKSVKNIQQTNNMPVSTQKEEELKKILPNIDKIPNPFLSSKYLYSFEFIDKTSLSIVSPPKDAIEIYDTYFVGTFFNQETKTLQVIINKNGKDQYISKGDIINEEYGKLKLMKIYTNFLLFMDKNGKKYYIQK